MARFGEGSGPVYLENVACSGFEVNLFECMSNLNPICDHSRDAGVSCTLIRKFTTFN